MINEFFNFIDKIINNTSHSIDFKIEDKLLKKEKQLGINIPNILRQFYIRYSGNNDILNAFYILNDIDELNIEENILIIGYSNDSINISLSIGKDKWIQYEDLNDFLINAVVFQAINMLEASAQLYASEITLEEFFTPLNKLENSDIKIISYISKNKKILASHFISDNIIYFGANTDEILEEFEEKSNVEFDWL